MRYGINVTVQPTIEPVHMAEAKAHLRVDSDDEDDYIDSLVAAARSMVEDHTHRVLISTTLELSLDGFPLIGDRFGGAIRIPRSPVQSITSIQYIDTNGDTQTLAASKYRVDTKSLVPRITPAYSEEWPSTHPVTNAVTVTFVAGYGAAASDVPVTLRHAIKLIVATYYDPVRSNVVVGTSASELPQSAAFLLGPYRVSTHGGVGV